MANAVNTETHRSNLVAFPKPMWPDTTWDNRADVARYDLGQSSRCGPIRLGTIVQFLQFYFCVIT